MIERAIEAGRRADRLGPAFLEAYRAAVARLTGVDAPGSLCVNEQGPPHPRNVRVELRDGRVYGEKRWITGADGCAVLWVAARVGAEGDRVRLVVAPVAADAPGVRIAAMPATPFTPEIAHAAVVFDGAPAGAPLPGDGWADVVKPFRTVEDVFVLAAACAYVARGAREPEIAEDLAFALAALRRLAEEDPREAATHRALAGLLRFAKPAIDAAARGLSGEERARWERDRPLLEIAETARRARREAAWSP